MRRALLALLLFAAPMHAQEEDAILERARLYAQRHGEHGRIDPEVRRRAVAAAYGRWQRERRSLTALGAPVWTSLGPTNGAGRAIAIEPASTAGTLLVGTADGGVWKTTSSGGSWTPLTDGLSDLSVGAVAIAPSTPSTIYIGTGEGGYAGDFVPGIGFFTSTDGGGSWTLGPSMVSRIFYRLSVSPTDPLDVVAGTGAGGFRSTDGGATWTPFSITPAGSYGDVTDLVRDPSAPSTLYAATWGYRAGGATPAHVLKSTDGGSTWADRSNGLPASTLSSFYERMQIAIAPSSPSTLYAATGLLTAGGDVVSHVYRTTNGADTWTERTALSTSATHDVSHYLGPQGWYDNALVVSPTDPAVVNLGGVHYVRTTDGGLTFGEGSSSVHVDVHDFRYQGSLLYVANDGGVSLSSDDGASWSAVNNGLVTRQFYSIALDAAHPNRVVGGTQDNGSVQRQDAGGTSWRTINGGDGIDCAVSAAAPELGYTTYEYGSIFRTKDVGSAATPVFRSVNPVYMPGEVQPFWTVLVEDRHHPATLLTGSSRVWRTTNGGDSWLPLSTTTTDGSTWTASSAVSAIAIAPGDANVMMVAKNSPDYVVFRSTNGGASWARADSGLPLPNVNGLEIEASSPLNAWAAIATTIGPTVFRTTDGGATWNAKSSGLPSSFAAQCVRADPGTGDVYAGTDVGLYASTDHGGSWQPFGAGLPASSVQDIRIADDRSSLFVATHGRGVWQAPLSPSANDPPAASITGPAGPLSVAKGTTVAFSGGISDPDGGDAVMGTWLFTDDWSTRAATAGTSRVVHTFTRPGLFPVSLTATDSHGAAASAFVNVSVLEAADACGTPRLVPGAGPFAWSAVLENETSSGSDAGTSCFPYSSDTTVWLQFTPAASHSYEIETCGALFTTALAVETGPACGPYVEIGCNTDGDGLNSACGGARGSVVTVSLTGGTTYRIRVNASLSGDAGTIPLTIRTSPPPANGPRVYGLSAYSDAPPGGKPVAVYGAGFLAGATVSFGGAAAPNVALVDEGTLTCTIPAHAAAAVDVVVTNPSSAGSATLGGAFTYVPENGDANGDGTIDVADVFYLINALFASGPAPVGAADVNGDGVVDIADVFYLINDLFAGGPPPV